MTDLVSSIQNGGLSALSDVDIAKALTEVSTDSSIGGGLAAYLSFSGKTGRYTIGQDKQEVGDDKRFVIDPMSIIKGWICWKNSAPVGKHQWSVYTPEKAVPESELPDNGPYRANSGDGWHPVLGFTCFDTDSPGVPIEFHSSSKSGISSLQRLFAEMAARAKSGEPTVPVIGLGVESFASQGHKNYKPVFQVDMWTTSQIAIKFAAGDMSIQEFMQG